MVFKYFFSSRIFFSKWNLNVKSQYLKGKKQTSSEWSGHRGLGQLHLPFPLPPLPHPSSLEKVWKTLTWSLQPSSSIAYPQKMLFCLCQDTSSELSPKRDTYCNKKNNNNFLQGKREIVASHHLPTCPWAPHLFLLEEKICKLNWNQKTGLLSPYFKYKVLSKSSHFLPYFLLYI